MFYAGVHKKQKRKRKEQRMKKYFAVITVILSLLFCLSIASAEDKCTSMQKSMQQYEILIGVSKDKNLTKEQIDAKIAAAAQQWTTTIAEVAQQDLALLEAFVGLMNRFDRALKAGKANNLELRDSFMNEARKKFQEMREICPSLTFNPGI
jgi:hypothetical protein